MFSPEGSSSSPKKKGKKRNPWSDSEESGASDSDMDDDIKPDVVIPRDTTGRRAAGYCIFIFLYKNVVIYWGDLIKIHQK